MITQADAGKAPAERLTRGASAGWYAPLPRRPHATRSVPAILCILMTFAIGALTGVLSADWATSGRPPLGALSVGSWVTWPALGGRDVDPYARAITVRSGALPLGTGEGLEFLAARDDAGRPLQASCSYRIGGAMPAARAWTLTVYDTAGKMHGPRAGLTSAEVLRAPSGEAQIALSHRVSPGNWLPLPPAGRFVLALRLYDSPQSADAAAIEPAAMPRIVRGDCT